jgi:hypothetical protein
MKNISRLFVFSLILIFFCCKKEYPIPDPIIIPEPPVYVPIYAPGDTSMGAAYAQKLTASWKASVYCERSFFDATKLSIAFYTYASDGLSTRESIGLDAFPKNLPGTYKFTPQITGVKDLEPGEIFTGYSTWTSDGDVLQDLYLVDSTDIQNRLVITQIDLLNKRVEGTFHISYNLQEPRINPKKVTFSVGRFWARIRD